VRPSDALHRETGSDIRALTRDLAALLGFSAALAVAVGAIKTPLHMPGHSAVIWMPILVLAGCQRRRGMAVGSALVGGGVAALWGGVGVVEFAGLLASGAAVEACGLGRSARARGLWMLLAGMLAHLGKLGIKVLVVGVAGLPLNRSGLPLVPTLAQYAAFGLIGGAVAWGALSAWHRLRGSRTDETGHGPAA